jgi:AraC family transcriptional regulator, regulatory protein of adaptative response / methylated-DNA-[protein]-cysteine methyltransferase
MNVELSTTFTKVFGEVRDWNPSEVAVTWLPSPVGPLLLGSTSKGLCWLEFTEADALAKAKKRIREQQGEPVAVKKHPILDQAIAELTEYFAGKRRDFTIPLDLAGTSFQQSVWQKLQKIPYGQTWSYEDLAIAVKKTPTACRAVGQANGRNPVVIVVPCHRVINKGGGLGGYGGELWRKEKLLELEGAM